MLEGIVWSISEARWVESLLVRCPRVKRRQNRRPSRVDWWGKPCCRFSLPSLENFPWFLCPCSWPTCRALILRLRSLVDRRRKSLRSPPRPLGRSRARLLSTVPDQTSVSSGGFESCTRFRVFEPCPLISLVLGVFAGSHVRMFCSCLDGLRAKSIQLPRGLEVKESVGTEAPIQALCVASHLTTVSQVFRLVLLHIGAGRERARKGCSRGGKTEG